MNVRLIVITVTLFLFLFVLAIPMKMANGKLESLLLQEKRLEDSVSVARYNLALERKIIDSLSSRERIYEAAKKMGLEMHVPATKITGGAK